MKSRINANECIICQSELTTPRDQVPVNLVEEKIRHCELELKTTESELATARKTLEESESERKQTIIEIQLLQTAIAKGRARREFLLRQLPQEEGKLHERQQELGFLRARIEVLQRDLEEKRMFFTNIIEDANVSVRRQATEIQNSFREYAHEFLLEECRLIWSPKSSRLGQTGRRFDFPAFELDLGGSNFISTIRRSGPDDVSESQREFIEISFRMALAKVAARGNVSSLVMDAPESSLDAVFVDRAARILGTFGRPETGNRLIVTSNLVSGRLIPSLLKRASDLNGRMERVVDLFSVAAPTAALRQLRGEYDKAKDELLREAFSVE